MKIDVITGNTSDMEEGGKPKKIIGEILYYVTMHQDGKKVVVTVDAETGAYNDKNYQ